MTPIVHGLEDEFEEQIAVIQLDAAQKANAELQNQYDLRGHPSFAVLDSNGRVVSTLLWAPNRIDYSPGDFDCGRSVSTRI